MRRKIGHAGGVLVFGWLAGASTRVSCEEKHKAKSFPSEGFHLLARR
jgi:hypothetical protein